MRFFVSTQFPVDELVFQTAWTQCTAPSIPYFKPPQIWSSWHALVALGPVNVITHLAKICCQVSPTPTVQTTGHLSSVIRRPDINAWLDAQGGFWLCIQWMKISTHICEVFLSSPNFNSHLCRSYKYMISRPRLYKSLCAADLTTSYVISKELK